MLIVDHYAVARDAIWGSVVAALAAEVVATVRRGNLDRGTDGPSLDRGTRQVLVIATVAGIVAGTQIARHAAGFRAGANTWAAYAVGLAILWAGIGLRLWAVWSLGRFFRRDVRIVSGQTVHTSGPYRFVRHPAYLGDLLIAFGFVVAWGSWVAAAIAVAIALAGHLPRIRVEEAALRRALGEAYDRYAARRARLVPGVW
jgi:protein-S-isoprenylcysteine O-methyltransferase Ste14